MADTKKPPRVGNKLGQVFARAEKRITRRFRRLEKKIDQSNKKTLKELEELEAMVTRISKHAGGFRFSVHPFNCLETRPDGTLMRPIEQD